MYPGSQQTPSCSICRGSIPIKIRSTIGQPCGLISTDSRELEIKFGTTTGSPCFYSAMWVNAVLPATFEYVFFDNGVNVPLALPCASYAKETSRPQRNSFRLGSYMRKYLRNRASCGGIVAPRVHEHLNEPFGSRVPAASFHSAGRSHHATW